MDPQRRAKTDPLRRLIDGAAGLPERSTMVGDAPIGSNMHSKRIKRDMGGL